jgi:hypothetical protein
VARYKQTIAHNRSFFLYFFLFFFLSFFLSFCFGLAASAPLDDDLVDVTRDAVWAPLRFLYRTPSEVATGVATWPAAMAADSLDPGQTGTSTIGGHRVCTFLLVKDQRYLLPPVS